MTNFSVNFTQIVNEMEEKKEVLAYSPLFSVMRSALRQVFLLGEGLVPLDTSRINGSASV